MLHIHPIITCMHACAHAYMHTCRHTDIQVTCIIIHAHIHTHIHTYMHACIHACIGVCVGVVTVIAQSMPLSITFLTVYIKPVLSLQNLMGTTTLPLPARRWVDAMSKFLPNIISSERKMDPIARMMISAFTILHHLQWVKCVHRLIA